MRVVLILPVYCDIRSAKLIRTFAEHGYQITVICLKTEFVEVFEPYINPYQDNIEIIQVKNRVAPNFPFDLSRDKSITGIIQQIKPDLVYIRDILISRVLKRLKSLPVKLVLDICDNIPEVLQHLMPFPVKQLARLIADNIEKQAISNADLVLFVSKESSEYISKKHHYNLKPQMIIPNLPWISPGDHQPELKFKNGKMIYIGTLDWKIRDIQTVIKAIGLLNREGIKICFDIYYFGNEHEIIAAYGKLARKMGVLDQIGFFKAVPLDRMKNILRQYSFGVVPHFRNISIDYTIPNKIFDYMQAGLTVLASDNPAMKSLVEDFKVGLTYKGSSASDCAAKIRLLLKDPSMGEEGPKAISADLNWQKAIAGLLDFLQLPSREAI